MIARGIEGFLRDKKNLTTDSLKSPEGWLIQAKQTEGWKKFAGMDTVIQVQLMPTGERLTVNAGSGKWIDKAGAATVGMVLFAPLAVTAAIGAWGQKKLPEEIFDFIERFIQSGGKSAIITMGASQALKDGQVLCPNCHIANDKGQKFCSSCGTKLVATCPKCQSDVPFGIKFCPECGTPAVQARTFLETRTGCFVFVFTPKHGSWLNLIESFFGKMARQCLHGIRVESKQELIDRIYRYCDEINEAPVVYHWTYKTDVITAEDIAEADIDPELRYMS